MSPTVELLRQALALLGQPWAYVVGILVIVALGFSTIKHPLLFHRELRDKQLRRRLQAVRALRRLGLTDLADHAEIELHFQQLTGLPGVRGQYQALDQIYQSVSDRYKWKHMGAIVPYVRTDDLGQPTLERIPAVAYVMALIFALIAYALLVLAAALILTLVQIWLTGGIGAASRDPHFWPVFVMGLPVCTIGGAGSVVLFLRLGRAVDISRTWKRRVQAVSQAARPNST